MRLEGHSINKSTWAMLVPPDNYHDIVGGDVVRTIGADSSGNELVGDGGVDDAADSQQHICEVPLGHW